MISNYLLSKAWCFDTPMKVRAKRAKKKNSLEFPTMGWAFELRVVLVI